MTKKELNALTKIAKKDHRADGKQNRPGKTF